MFNFIFTPANFPCNFCIKIILFLYEFQYDINKIIKNKAKHGVDFEEAKALFKDENLLVLPLIFEDEKRYAYVGKLNNKIWTAIITCRNDTIRIISVRRAHKIEERLYESE